MLRRTPAHFGGINAIDHTFHVASPVYCGKRSNERGARFCCCEKHNRFFSCFSFPCNFTSLWQGRVLYLRWKKHGVQMDRDLPRKMIFEHRAQGLRFSNLDFFSWCWCFYGLGIVYTQDRHHLVQFWSLDSSLTGFSHFEGSGKYAP